MLEVKLLEVERKALADLVYSALSNRAAHLKALEYSPIAHAKEAARMKARTDMLTALAARLDPPKPPKGKKP